MTVRPPISSAASEKFEALGERMVGRAYLLWLLGVGIGIVKLKAEKFSFSGVAYTIENPEAIQGLIFIGCILCYVVVMAQLVLFSLQWSYRTRTVHRRMLHAATSPRFTLQGKTRGQILVIKRVARVMFGGFLIVAGLILFLPVIHILLFERPAVSLALKAILSAT
jgi:hypothetical protein